MFVTWQKETALPPRQDAGRSTTPGMYVRVLGPPTYKHHLTDHCTSVARKYHTR